MEYNRDLKVGDIVYLNMPYAKYKHLLGAYATVVSAPNAQQHTNSDRFDVIYYDEEDNRIKQINVARFDIIKPAMSCTFQPGDIVRYKPTSINDYFFKDQEAKILNYVDDIKGLLFDIQFASDNQHKGVIKYNVPASNLVLVSRKNTPISKRPEKVNKEMRSKYKVGDKVLVRKDLVLGQKYGGFPLYGNMGAYMGKTIEITQVLDTNRYQADNNVWDWTDEMIEEKTSYNKQPIIDTDFLI